MSMIRDEKQQKAIQVIHDLIIKARNLASQSSCSDLVEFLDRLEYLPALILESGDNTALFDKFLEEQCTSFDCKEILNKYRS